MLAIQLIDDLRDEAELAKQGQFHRDPAPLMTEAADYITNLAQRYDQRGEDMQVLRDFGAEALDVLRHITDVSSCREYGPVAGQEAPCLRHLDEEGFDLCWHCRAVSLITDTEAGRFRGLFAEGR